MVSKKLDLLDLDLEPPLEAAPVQSIGGGARVNPPKLQPVTERAAGTLEAELEAIEEAYLESSDAAAEQAGGGARVPPPKLNVVGEYSGEAAEEAFEELQHSAPPSTFEEECRVRRIANPKLKMHSRTTSKTGVRSSESSPLP